MKKTKKLLCVLLAFTLLFTSVVNAEEIGSREAMSKEEVETETTETIEEREKDIEKLLGFNDYEGEEELDTELSSVGDAVEGTYKPYFYNIAAAGGQKITLSNGDSHFALFCVNYIPKGSSTGTTFYLTYCIEYNKSLHTSTEFTAFNNKADYKNLTDEQKKKLGVVLGAGVQENWPGIVNENGFADMSRQLWEKYYATQLAVWTITGSPLNDQYEANLIGSTCGSFYSYLMGLADNLYIKPSFAADDISLAPIYKMTYNQSTKTYSVTLIDTNGVLSSYGTSLYTNTSGITYSQSGNTLTITSDHYISPDTQVSLNLAKPTIQAGEVMYFVVEDEQDQIWARSGYTDPVSAYINIYTEKSDIKIYKTDSTTGAFLSNCLFGIFEDEDCNADSYVGYIISNENSTCDAYLAPGTYYLREVSCPEGYALNPNVYRVTTSSEEITTLNVTNERIGSLEINKTDSVTSIAMSGVRFGIYNDAACTDLNQEVTTDKKGKATVYLDAGKYYVKELETKTNYALDNSIKTVTIVNTQTTKLNVTNDHYGSLEINKTDATTSITMSGIKFDIYNDEACTDLNQELTTDENGKATMYLPAGKYYVREVETDANHYLSEDVSEITVENTQATRLDIANNAFGKIKLTKLGDNVVGANTYTSNYGDYKRLTFDKVSVKDVEFTIKDLEGNVVDVVNTNNDGIAISKDLPTGKYLVYETKTPDGLIPITEPVEVEIKATGETYETLTFGGETVINNNVVSAEINVFKEGEILNVEDGIYYFGTKPLEGVVYAVYANMDIYNQSKELIVSKNDCIGYIVTNAEGKATLKESLVAGDYYYKEIKTLEGYILDEEIKPFSVKLGNSEIEVINVNKENPDINMLYKAEIQLVKVDESNREITLSDVQFELYQKSLDESEDKLMGTYTTDENGKIEVDELPFGLYYFKEIKAKDGYILDNSAIDIVVDGSSEILVLEFANKRDKDIPEKPRDPYTPKTGDMIIPVLLINCMGIALCGLASINKRKKNVLKR